MSLQTPTLEIALLVGFSCKQRTGFRTEKRGKPPGAAIKAAGSTQVVHKLVSYFAHKHTVVLQYGETLIILQIAI